MACESDTLVRGEAYARGFADQVDGGTYTDFATTEAYLFVCSTEGQPRLRLDWVPGGPNNAGAAETVNGNPAVVFRLTADQTRAADFLPGTLYQLWFHVGPLTGSGGYGTDEGTLTVSGLGDNQAVA